MKLEKFISFFVFAVLFACSPTGFDNRGIETGNDTPVTIDDTSYVKSDTDHTDVLTLSNIGIAKRFVNQLNIRPIFDSLYLLI